MRREVLSLGGGVWAAVEVEVGPGVAVASIEPGVLLARRRALVDGETPGAGIEGGLPGIEGLTGADVERLAAGRFTVERVPRYGAVWIVGRAEVDVDAAALIEALSREVVRLREGGGDVSDL